jgi:hypothetical protein
VVFIGTDQKIYEFYYDTKWNWHPLPLDQGVVPIANSAMNAYVTPVTSPDQQHVNFIGMLDSSLHVYELMNPRGDTHWYLKPLDTKVTDASVSQFSRLAGYETSYNNQQHVSFVDTENRVWELFNTAGSTDWTPNALWKTAKEKNNPNNPPPNAGRGSDLAGYQTTWDNKQHVVYTTETDEVCELYYADNAWWWTKP